MGLYELLSFDLNFGAECAQSVFRTTQNSQLKHWDHFFKIEFIKKMKH